VTTDDRKSIMLDTLDRSLGVVTTACRAAGISRNTHYRWMKEDAEYATAVDDLQNVALDFAETKLFEQMRNNNTAAVIFYLKTKGKKRGYFEHRTQDITSDSQPLTINFVPADHDADGSSDL